MRRSTMKKSIFTLLLLIVFITVAACGNQTSNENEPKSEDSNQVEDEANKEDTSGSEEVENDEQTEEEEVKEIIMDKADEVLKLLKVKNANELANYVHPEKGVLFSPYSFIDKDAVTFDKEKVKGLFEDVETE
jgi:outer membrane lipopolysaccharide assembly protein LptE/RlpB